MAENNFSINNDGSGYAHKMDNAVTNAMQNWWKSLSKEELLAYLADQPNVTADNIRDMIRNMNSVLAFDIRFSTASEDAVTDFHTK